MNFEIILSLAGMAFTASITPGPNNSMLASSGATYGVRASIPHVLGIILGYPLMIFLVGIGLGELFHQNPALQQAMRLVGAVMMLWIAWKIANAEPPGAQSKGTKPLTFIQAAAFQWINPKGWLAAIAITTQFVTSHAPLKGTIIVAIVFIIAGLISTVTWLLFGRLIGQWLRTPKRLKIFNLTMALMLVGFLAVIFIGQ
ncbi:MAG: threonine/homoserine/homoserine lactone efflux protein [Paracoccaceae bacterium]|jgi:threonine/homoserine/homoserine lactone efflux protein